MYMTIIACNYFMSSGCDNSKLIKVANAKTN